MESITAQSGQSATKTVLRTALGVVLGMLIGGMLLAAMFGGRARWMLPEIPVHAISSATNDGFAVATGPLDDEIEGLFMLDTLTGELTCRVLNLRSAKFADGALFAANVATDMNLEQGKRPKYLLVTGRASFPRGSGVARPAYSVAYVVESNTGYYAAYGVPWRRGHSSQDMPQGGQLITLDVGRSRTAAVRNVGE